MKIRLMFTLTFMLLIASSMTQAIIMGASTWKKMIDGQPHYLVFLHDFHINLKENDANAAQRSDLLEELSAFKHKLGTDQVMVICEDMMHCTQAAVDDQERRLLLNTERKAVEDRYNKGDRQRFLATLTHACMERKIAVENIEFRQLLQGAIVMPSGIKIVPTVELLLTPQVQRYQTIQAKLVAFNGDSKVRLYTKQVLDDGEKRLKDVKESFAKTDCSKSDEWNRAYKAYYDVYDVIFNNFINVNILHAMIAHQDKKLLVACAGSWHLRELEKELKAFGFERIHDVSNITELLPDDGFSVISTDPNATLELNDQIRLRRFPFQEHVGVAMIERDFRPVNIKEAFSPIHEQIEYVVV